MGKQLKVTIYCCIREILCDRLNTLKIILRGWEIMLRHIYDRLEVTGDLTAVFDPRAADGLEKAVEHLRQVRNGKMVWLRAATTAKAGSYRLQVNSFLTYDEINGKTEAEIWRMFDLNTDKYIETVIRAKVSSF